MAQLLADIAKKRDVPVDGSTLAKWAGVLGTEVTGDHVQVWRACQGQVLADFAAMVSRPAKSIAETRELLTELERRMKMVRDLTVVVVARVRNPVACVSAERCQDPCFGTCSQQP